MRALDRKVIRDLWHLRGQVVAISLVIASGVAVLIMALSTVDALRQTTDAYYDRYRLGDVFTGLKRAPEHVSKTIGAIPGVQTVQTRIVEFATLDIETFDEPVIGQLVSVPDQGEPLLNKLVLRGGRWLEPNQHDEVILNEPFAEAHGLIPGDELVAILKGNRRTLRVVGIALSPEFIYSLGPGALMPDDERFGVMWMNRDAMAAAFDQKGSFNNVSLALSRGTSPDGVIERIDQILEKYGSVGAIAQADQLSNWFVMNEIDQQATMSKILPTIFLVIAAFLANMVMGRLMNTERSQIGLMKAFGYSDWEVGLHYAKIVAGIAVVGIGIGAVLGTWFGRINTDMYAELFRFPLLLYGINPRAFAIAGGLSLVAALAGAMGAVRQAMQLPPAQAMLPPSPPVFKPSRILETRFGRWLDQPTRIILRNIIRAPGRAILTGTGIAASIGLLILALSWVDSLDYLAQSYFFDAQRQNVMIGLSDPKGTRVLHELRHMPGVVSTEPARIVSADFSVGAVTHRGSVSGIADRAKLQPIYDDKRKTTIAAPPNGLVLGSYLANKLGVGVGDEVWVRVLEGRRPEVPLPVVDLVETYIGMPAYLHIDALNRLLKERPSVGYVNLLVDPAEESRLYSELKDIPAVSGVMLRQAAIDSYYETVVDHTMVFIRMFTALAFAMGFGVAYNSTRITLSERGRELATLRVLGFTRGEISYILLGEVAVLVCLALPLGCLVGRLLSYLVATTFATELFRVPYSIEASTFGVAMLVVLAAALLSGGIVRRRVDRLNLIEVLKTRE